MMNAKCKIVVQYFCILPSTFCIYTTSVNPSILSPVFKVTIAFLNPDVLPEICPKLRPLPLLLIMLTWMTFTLYAASTAFFTSTLLASFLTLKTYLLMPAKCPAFSETLGIIKMLGTLTIVAEEAAGAACSVFSSFCSSVLVPKIAIWVVDQFISRSVNQ
jgi:hypothetical protein